MNTVRLPAQIENAGEEDTPGRRFDFHPDVDRLSLAVYGEIARDLRVEGFARRELR